MQVSFGVTQCREDAQGHFAADGAHVVGLAVAGEDDDVVVLRGQRPTGGLHL
jgi:hypothetical protein